MANKRGGKVETVLKFFRVTKDYSNGIHALKNASFEVKEGEFISIIGPSGSGKSTILRSINKLISITDGKIILDGVSVNEQKGRNLRHLRRSIGMIFQNYNLVYSLSVLQNVLHGCLGYMSGLKGIFGIYSEADKKRALELLEELGILSTAQTENGWQSEIYITICEGKYHQVKRMMEALGKKVLYLKRLSMGGLTLPENLEKGQYQKLSREEILKLTAETK